jgi:trehalose 6-phosphate phosphatase
VAADPARAQAAIEALLRGLPPGLQHFGGKRVVNLLAQGTPDKADAVRALVARSGSPVALFAGDDVNDEPVFEQAPPDWLTIRVGRADAASQARFFLHGPQEMAMLLQRLRVQVDDAQPGPSGL